MSLLTLQGRISLQGIISSYNFIIDQISVKPVAAYSLRQLSSYYNGKAINVRSTDGRTQDIGFVNGALDTTTLLSVVTGTNSGFVVTWYDQSGNGNNATQATTTKQLQIVNAGSLVKTNNLPSLSASGATYLQTTTNFSYVPPASYTYNSVFYVNSYTNGILSNILGSSTNASNFALNDTPPYGWFVIFNGNKYSSTLLSNNNTSYVATVTIATNPSIYINGTSVGTGTWSYLGTGLTNFMIGAAGYNPTSRGLNGNFQEVMLFPSPLPTTDRQLLEHNQEKYYSISGI